MRFYVDPTTKAYRAWQAAAGAERDLLGRIALTPQAYWVGNWADPAHAATEVADYTGRAVADGSTGLLAVYAIPGRDNGSYSAGGVAQGEYERWVDAVADAVVGQPWVVLEPDALAQLGDAPGQGDRVGMLRYAVERLATAGARVYLDAGNLLWLEPPVAAERLATVGLESAAGFALNVSNYHPTDATVAYGRAVAAALGGGRFVVDTSRNGNGHDGQWCNPRGRAIGEPPRVVEGDPALDALLWVKLPGESDGTCNGGPPAGQWWQEMALELAANAAPHPPTEECTPIGANHATPRAFLDPSASAAP